MHIALVCMLHRLGALVSGKPSRIGVGRHSVQQPEAGGKQGRGCSLMHADGRQHFCMVEDDLGGGCIGASLLIGRCSQVALRFACSVALRR